VDADDARTDRDAEDELVDDDDLPDEVDRDEWERSGTSLRALVPSDQALAAVLGVTRPAVRRAVEDGRIVRSADAQWHVFAVVQDWRENTWGALQRRGAVPRPWLDPRRRWTAALRARLIRRTRAVGGTVEAYDPTARTWRATPDPLELLEAGTRSPVPSADWMEIESIIPRAGCWLEWFTSGAPRIAEACGADVATLRPALEREGYTMLRYMLRGALAAHGWTVDLEDERLQ
jgi:predicted DCC family thiol-disulfide oxidoreductase YuxK